MKETELFGQIIISELVHLIKDHKVVQTPQVVADTFTYSQLQSFCNDNLILVVSRENHPDYLEPITNIKLRAIHDYVHFRYNYDFSMAGEYSTYRKTMELLGKTKLHKLLLDRLDNFLYSEIVIQAYKYFIDGGFDKQIYYPDAKKVVTSQDIVKLIAMR